MVRVRIADRESRVPGIYSETPSHDFLSNTSKRCFTLIVVLLKLCNLLLRCAAKFLSVRSFWGYLIIFEFTRAFFLSISYSKIVTNYFKVPKTTLYQSGKIRHKVSLKRSLLTSRANMYLHVDKPCHATPFYSV